MILLVGYGNVLRCDDSAGIVTVERIAGKRIPGVEVRAMHQLHVELLEDLQRYERVIFVDAASDGEAVALRKVNSGEKREAASSHHLAPELLCSLASKIWSQCPQIYVCTIRGSCFDFGTQLSPEVEEQIDQAVAAIEGFISGVECHA